MDLFRTVILLKLKSELDSVKMWWIYSAKSLQQVKGNGGRFGVLLSVVGLRRCDSTENQGKFCPGNRAGMHRTGSVGLKSVGRKAKPDLNDSTPAIVLENIHKL